ncbi:MAG: hypothetical protein ACK5RL_07625 [Acidimicrobiales bacterium]
MTSGPRPSNLMSDPRFDEPNLSDDGVLTDEGLAAALDGVAVDSDDPLAAFLDDARRLPDRFTPEPGGSLSEWFSSRPARVTPPGEPGTLIRPVSRPVFASETVETSPGSGPVAPRSGSILEQVSSQDTRSDATEDDPVPDPEVASPGPPPFPIVASAVETGTLRAAAAANPAPSNRSGEAPATPVLQPAHDEPIAGPPPSARSTRGLVPDDGPPAVEGVWALAPLPPPTGAGRPSRASRADTISELLRPTGPKLLAGAAVIVFLLTAAHTLGLVTLPLPGGGDGSGDQTVAADELQAAAPTAVADGSAEATTSTTTAASSLTTASSVPATETTAAPSTAPPATAPRTSTSARRRTTSTARPTTAAPTRPTEPQETSSIPATAAPTAPSTSAPSSTASPTAPPPSIPPSSTSPSSTPSSSTPSSSSPSSSAPAGTANLTPGVPASVPDDLVAGSYRGRSEAACDVIVYTADGQERVTSADPGGIIQFMVADGDRVTVGDGCPTGYTS